MGCPNIMFLPLLLQLFWSLQIQAFTDCSEFFLGACNGDDYAAFIKFNTGTQAKCQAHCTIEEDCQFYRFEADPQQGVDCHLYDEKFSAYVNHCNLRGGPKREGANQGSSCFDASGDTCEVAQQEIAYSLGRLLMELTLPRTHLIVRKFAEVILTARCGLLRKKRRDAACTTMLA